MGGYGLKMRGHARCPYPDCDRAIGSPRDPDLVVGETAGRRFPPVLIECPACGREILLTWRRDVGTIYATRRGDDGRVPGQDGPANSHTDKPQSGVNSG